MAKGPTLKLQLDTLPADEAVKAFRADLARLSRDGSLSIQQIEDAKKDLDKAFKEATSSSLRKEFKALREEADVVERSLHDVGSAAERADHALKDVDQASSKTGGAFGKLGGAVKGFVATYLAGQLFGALQRVGTDLVRISTDAEETESRFRTVFGAMAGQVEAFGEQFAALAGLTRSEFQRLTSDVGAVLQGLGLSTEQVASETVRITKLAADLASFHNTTTEEALGAIRSGIVGESEPLKRYGIVLREAMVDGSTEAAKAVSRLDLIMRGAGKAVGDLERTGGSTANQIKQLAAEARQLREDLARKLTPVFADVVGWLRQLTGETDDQREAFVRMVADGVREGVIALRNLGAATWEVITATKRLSDALTGSAGLDAAASNVSVTLDVLMWTLRRTADIVDNAALSWLRLYRVVFQGRAILARSGTDVDESAKAMIASLNADIDAIKAAKEARENAAVSRHHDAAELRAEMDALREKTVAYASVLHGTGQTAADFFAQLRGGAASVSFGPVASPPSEPEDEGGLTPEQIAEQKRMAEEAAKERERRQKAEAAALVKARADLAAAEQEAAEGRLRRAGLTEAQVLQTRIDRLNAEVMTVEAGSAREIEIAAERLRLLNQIEQAQHDEKLTAQKQQGEELREQARRGFQMGQADYEAYLQELATLTEADLVEPLDLGEWFYVDADDVKKRIEDGLITSINDVQKALAGLQADYDAADTQPAREQIAALIRYLERLGFSFKDSGDDAEEWHEKINAAATAASDVLGAVTDVEAAYTDRRVQIAENAADREIAALERRLAAEGLAQEQRAVLERDLTDARRAADAERAKIEEAAARRRKALVMVEIVIETARAVAGAIANPILAAAIGAAGAAQLAIVAATPIPSAASVGAPSGGTSGEPAGDRSAGNRSGSPTPGASPSASPVASPSYSPSPPLGPGPSTYDRILAQIHAGIEPDVPVPPGIGGGTGPSSRYATGGSLTVQIDQKEVVGELRRVTDKLGGVERRLERLEPQVNVTIGDEQVYEANKRQERREARMRPQTRR